MKTPSIPVLLTLPLVMLLAGVAATSDRVPDAAWNSQAAPAADSVSSAGAHPFDWLEGHWVGQGFGGTIDEVWLPARGGTMLGTFRLVVDGADVFYEIFTIDEGPDGHVMRLKHFNPNLDGWEEKDAALVWPAEAVVGTSARFGPVLYERNGDELVATVNVNEGTKTGAERIVYRPAGQRPGGSP